LKRIKNVLVELTAFEDREINECLASDFSEDSALGGVDVYMLYMSLMHVFDVIDGVGRTTFTLEDMS